MSKVASGDIQSGTCAGFLQGRHSKLNAQSSFLMALRDAGRQWTAAWLDRNGASLGGKSTYDLSRLLT
jgi:hypothetical protein